jgi:hypothetical protein
VKRSSLYRKIKNTDIIATVMEVLNALKKYAEGFLLINSSLSL